MNTQAYFDNINTVISQELKLAEKSVIVAVAWFTDTALFSDLINLCLKGLHIELIINDDSINKNSLIDYELLVKHNGKVFYNNDDCLMHNKFAVIDDDLVINGSYNWTNRAKYNHESITIIKGSKELASDFILEFNKLKESISNSESDSTIDFNIISLRLDALKNLILLKDYETIENQLILIKEYIGGKNNEITGLVNRINNCIVSRKLDESIRVIDSFNTKYRSISLYIDHEIEAIKLELISLKFQIPAIQNEIDEIEKLIVKFQNEYNHRLGKLVLSILELEKELARGDDNNYKEAQSNYERFNDSYKAEIKKQIYEVTEEERKLIKEKFRKASKLCHPDLVDETEKKEASEIFIRLKTAYDINNLNEVNNILNHLEKFGFKQATINENEKEILRDELLRFRKLRFELEDQVNKLKISETYILIASLGNWDQYFHEKQKEFEEYYSNLKKRINEY